MVFFGGEGDINCGNFPFVIILLVSALQATAPVTKVLSKLGTSLVKIADLAPLETGHQQVANNTKNKIRQIAHELRRLP